ncbi:MAG: PLP-dependent aspartate aminotransferase family protein [Acidimicrobiia bacterium]
MTDDAPVPGPGDPRWHLESRAITAGRTAAGDSLAPVLFPATTYEVATMADHRRLASSAHPDRYYSRFGSPTVADFEEAVADLEGAEAALAFASGMAAISAVVFGLCSTGDHVVVQRQVFSVTNALFAFHCPRFGIDVTFVDGTDAAAIVAAVRPGRTQLVFLETPANPRLDLVDLDAVGAISGPFTVVDSTFATPAVQRPLEHGVDLVLHAATKGIAGHNDALLGVIAGERDLVEAVWGWHGVQGGTASPFDAMNGLRGLRTLFPRVRQQAATAQALAEALAAHPAVAEVRYPGLDDHPQRELARRQMANGGTVLSFEVHGGAEAAAAVVDGVRLARIALSLGGPETIVSHPATVAGRFSPAERAAMGISDGMVRVSVGLEHPDDLVADLTGALDRLPAG